MTEKITDEELADLLEALKEHMVWAFVQRRLSWHSVVLDVFPRYCCRVTGISERR